MMPLWILLGVALAVLALAWVVQRFFRARLSGSARAVILRQLEHARSLPDPARRIVEGDIVLDHALKAVGFTGTFGEKLKKATARFSQPQAVWDAHKLRNRIAHEPGVRISDADAARALKAFERAIGDLL